MIERTNPTTLSASVDYGYSQLTAISATSKIVFVSGQLGDFADGQKAEGFEKQVGRSFENLRLALEAVGSGPEKVVKVTILVVGHTEDRLAIVSEHRRRFFGDARPASTLIPVQRLAGDWMEFEIDAVAVV
ncbi:RidA family protein [Litoreibacter roseus]|uniref:Enamine deaminase RidA n=1 Tax=Litoreibacter roseus TaxID=2601869 RepID=A0A6N6JBS7_9RHOB|nr:RidA family protein [Litoreibacter roseus]GFE63524.1 enamine deaminase RidA [Litoreibacter roseus]